MLLALAVALAAFDASDAVRQQFGLTVDLVQKDADEADTVVIVLRAWSAPASSAPPKS